MRILVVEDEVRLATLLQRTLVEEGYGVDVAFTGEETLDWLDPNLHDVLVLDVMLPGVDGLTVCRLVRQRHIPVPILLLTARDAITDRVAGLDAGAGDYLVKPFALAELLARVRAFDPATTRNAPADPPGRDRPARPSKPPSLARGHCDCPLQQGVPHPRVPDAQRGSGPDPDDDR